MTSTTGITETQRKRRGHIFVPPADIRKKTPGLYATEATPLADKILHVKWFCGSFTWYAAEVDWTTGQAFGWVDGPSPEWGYFDLNEMEQVKVGPFHIVERDKFWSPTKASEVLS